MKIRDEASYEAAMSRLLELENKVNDETPTNDPVYVELDMLANDIEAYEDVHYPIPEPTFLEIMQLRMYEMGLTQKKLAELLHIPASRLSAYLRGKREPTLSVARDISRQLDIEPSIVLGV